MAPRLRGLLPAWPVLAVLALPFTPSQAHAQASPLVIEVRGGTSIPLGGFSTGTAPGQGTTMAPSFGVDFTASGSGRRSIYLGFSQQRFGCQDAGCPSGGGRYVATSLDAGVRISLLTRGPVNPWLRLGGVSLRMETPSITNGPAGVSDRGYGGEVGFGVYVGAWSAVALNPGVRFTTAKVRLPGGQDLTLRYLVADLGFSLAF